MGDSIVKVGLILRLIQKRKKHMGTPLNASLLKGFEILGLFSESEPEITTATVVERLGTNTATAHRLLMTLEKSGAVSRTRRGHFTLGPRIEELGRLAEGANPWSYILTPWLEALTQELNESVMACRLSNLGPVCVGVARSRQTITVNISLGTLLPLHLTAQGKLWLAEMTASEREQRLRSLPVLGSTPPNMRTLNAELKRIRKDGVALNLGANEPDIAAVSVPIRDKTGRMRLSLSVFGLLSRFSEDFVSRCRPALLSAAGEIGRRL